MNFKEYGNKNKDTAEIEYTMTWNKWEPEYNFKGDIWWGKL